jgi:hypothetical protein
MQLFKLSALQDGSGKPWLCTSGQHQSPLHLTSSMTTASKGEAQRHDSFRIRL